MQAIIHTDGGARGNPGPSVRWISDLPIGVFTPLALVARLLAVTPGRTGEYLPRIPHRPRDASYV